MDDSEPRHSLGGSEDATVDQGGRKPQRFGLDMLEAGDILGRYVIISTLGEGAMGVVYRAYDPRLGREVALKRLRAGGTEARARMVREAHAMAKLSHPNVVAVYDVEDDADDVRIVMELVDGQTLSVWAESRTDWRELLPAYVGAGEGLAAAHAEGLVHRDFKPSNVLVSTSGQVKVADFGIAKGMLHEADREGSAQSPSIEIEAEASWDLNSRDSLEADLTEANTVIGTPLYMGPEQATGAKVDARSDQYAFCVALWRALTGSAPFHGDSFAEMTKHKLHEPPTMAAGVRLPRQVVAALERGLRPDPDDRWPSMRALLDALHSATRPRTAWRWVLAGTALVGTMTAVVLRPGSRPCQDVELELASTWNPQRKGDVQRLLTGFGVDYGPSVSQYVTAELDDYAEAWVAQRRDVCEANEIRGGASEELTRRRMQCLEAGRARLEATLDVLVTLELPELPAVDDVPPRPESLARCGDTKALLAAIEGELPEAPVGLQSRLAEAVALRKLGRTEAATAELQTLVDEAPDPVVPEFSVHTHLELGRARLAQGDPAAAEEAVRRAVDLAVEAQSPPLMFASSETLAELLMDTGSDATESKLHVDLITALAKRTQARPEELPRAWSLAGRLHQARGEHSEAADALGQAVDLGRARTHHPVELASDLLRYGASLLALRRATDAVAAYEEGAALLERSLGPTHPRCVEAKAGLAEARRQAGA